ncbi:uncharacterized protein LOC134254474 [Saccostrea cucullata]|uniref:uncharacterized protein LOC134254474 n=1 Tax=Saccostrea cuccullata TaxID=36930 RepID=UPI002ED3A049
MSNTGKLRDVRDLSEKGHEMYETSVEHFSSRIEEAWKFVEISLQSADDNQLTKSNLQSLCVLEESINKNFTKYSMIKEDFRQFLLRAKTSESEQLLKSLELKHYEYSASVEKVLKTISEQKQNAIETMTSVSNSQSRASNKSHFSSLVTLKRAKAQAARISIQYAEQEIKLRKMKAEIEEREKLMAAKEKANMERAKAEFEAEMHLLSIKKEAAAAEAELRVFQEEDQGSLFADLPGTEGGDELLSDRQFSDTRRVLDFSAEQNNLSHIDIQTNPLSHQANGLSEVKLPQTESSPLQDPSSSGALDPLVPEFKPQANHRSGTMNSQFSEFSKFLLKKELLMSRLKNYNDKPESFAAWKATFQSVMRELDVSTEEEVDLLIKYLGPESSKHANSIKTANFSNPAKGLSRIWERLNDRYGSPEMVEFALKQKLANVPKLTNKDNKKLFELSDFLSEIEAVKDNIEYSALLAYFDTSSGVVPIVNKLPHAIQEKWTTHAVNFKRKHNVSFPPFSVFVEFIRDISRVKNDPGFQYETNTYMTAEKVIHRGKNINIATKKTVSEVDKDAVECPIHHTRHSLNQCRAFRGKSLEERRKFVKDNNICFRCCETTNHNRRSCRRDIKCTECDSTTHTTALHPPTLQKSLTPSLAYGGEVNPQPNIDSKCTQVCGDARHYGKSCSKTVLVRVYRDGHPEKTVTLYAVIDDQSNRSLAKSDLLDYLGIHGQSAEYILTSCAGSIPSQGRRANGLVVESMDGSARLELPTVIECDGIPNVRAEIPTPEVALSYPHLLDIAQHIPALDDEASISLLIGRDLLEAHHILEQRLGYTGSPYAQRLCLGWVIVGESCLNKTHIPDVVNVNKIHTLSNGRPSIFTPCTNVFDIKETLKDIGSFSTIPGNVRQLSSDCDIFLKTKNDDKTALSVEDTQFLNLMDNEMVKDCEGSWTAPLPFKKQRPLLPNNLSQALSRAKMLTNNLQKNSTKKKHFLEFMSKVLSEGHAEPAPTLTKNQECWYLPLFGVYHPKKPEQIRGVFDSSAKFENISLNDVLMSGPDLTNNLLGVLLRFRQQPVAVMADIQRMFYCFKVKQEHRDYLRFLWHKDNDIEKEIIEFRMCVHVFGNSPSPAVATYGLRRTAEIAEKQYGSDVRKFVERNFYVDDALTSLPSSKEAVSLLKRAQEALQAEGNLRLHKICSNSSEVLLAFDKEDLAKDLRELDFNCDDLPLQRSLGVCWNINVDSFTFHVSVDEKPCTRRGVLSVINGLYDPLGFAMPVTIGGKLMLREAMVEPVEWDQPLPNDFQTKFDSWKDSLSALGSVNIPRTYDSLISAVERPRDLFVFTDASEKAIAAVAYLRTFDENNRSKLGFVMGKAKVAPKHGHTIPRLELCAAVMGVEIYENILQELDFKLNRVTFFTDSKVVLGYINNETKRFYVYVRNRIDKIRHLTSPDQWNYIPTNLNPADDATRSIPAASLQTSLWLNGPPENFIEQTHEDTSFPLVSPDKEVRSMKTAASADMGLGSYHFERFSTWKSLKRAVRTLKDLARSKTTDSDHIRVSDKESEICIIKTLQEEAFPSEMSALKSELPLPKQSNILTLSPYLDELGLLRVGGRLRNAKLDSVQINPVIIPKHHVSTLIIRYYHEKVFHQGRQITEGSIRNAGFWLIGAKRLITSCIHHCVKCRRLRGRQEEQRMADLPAERLEVAPPFTYIGIDVFGPWKISTRKTRGGEINSKRWALMITCLVIRAVHIEILEEMTSSCFINALRRFCAIRGEVKLIRSDCGTNFVGSVKDLNANIINTEDRPIKEYLVENGINWIFNPPHSSHMGGVWERMIGIARRILDSLLLDVKNLTHEVLTTLMAEVMSVMNSRPIVPVSSDPEHPIPLTPAALLTMKTEQTIQCFQLDSLCRKDLYKEQWKCVQYLADQFWVRWKNEYLPTLQHRRKWQQDSENLKEDDVVLLRDKTLHRNDWPLGIIVKTYASDDSKIRKVEVRTGKDRKVFTRSVNDVVLLVSE